MGLEKLSKQTKNDAMKCDIKCDNILKDNLTNLTSKNSSNHI